MGFKEMRACKWRYAYAESFALRLPLLLVVLEVRVELHVMTSHY